MSWIAEDRAAATPLEQYSTGATSTGRVRVATAMIALLSMMGAGAQVLALPVIIRAAITMLFVLIVPGATLIAVLLLCGVGVRHGRTVRLRLSLVVLSALAIPLGVSVLIATAQVMLWLDIWRPAEAMVLLAGLSMPILLAVTVSLTRPGDTRGEHMSRGGNSEDDSQPLKRTWVDAT